MCEWRTRQKIVPTRQKAIGATPLRRLCDGYLQFNNSLRAILTAADGILRPQVDRFRGKL